MDCRLTESNNYIAASACRISSYVLCSLRRRSAADCQPTSLYIKLIDNGLNIILLENVHLDTDKLKRKLDKLRTRAAKPATSGGLGDGSTEYVSLRTDKSRRRQVDLTSVGPGPRFLLQMFSYWIGGTGLIIHRANHHRQPTKMNHDWLHQKILKP